MDKGAIRMSTYAIHPVVMSAKIFDQSMMTCQHGQGKPYIVTSIFRKVSIHRVRQLRTQIKNELSCWPAGVDYQKDEKEKKLQKVNAKTNRKC
jgi:hypothetical protein